jgi:hypothetical protein
MVGLVGFLEVVPDRVLRKAKEGIVSRMFVEER